MISIVCVYNDREMLERILLPSLRKQTVKYELIDIDNTGNGNYHSAAEPLNSCGKRTKGKYIMFVHQDVELASDKWLEDTEKILDSLPKLGAAGPIGMSTRGRTPDERIRGCICNAGMGWGNPRWKNPRSPATGVQTLDECLMIMPRDKFFGFDEKVFNGWHCYGADYCLTALEKGLNVYAIPAYVYHRSRITNTKDLWKYQSRLYWKHRRWFKHIYTTSGSMSMLRFLSTPVLSALLKLYYHYRKDWIGQVVKELEDCHSILDVGCGYNSPLQHLKKNGRGHHLVGVDAFAPYIEESRKKGLHEWYIEEDIRELDFPDGRFDAVFCSEVLEHLTKEEGEELLQKMSRWAKQKVIITTPNGYVRQEGKDNPYQAHKSGWGIRELREYGFNDIRGMGGLKCLRSGDNAEIKYKPLYLFAAMSVASQALTDRLPRLAFQLLAIRRK